MNGSAILLGQPPSDYKSKKSRGDSSTNIELVVIANDVEEHFRHAKAEEAKIIREPGASGDKVLQGR